MGDFIKDLNKAQQEAVLQTGGPGLIIAGAGSGKTRVLTYRIAWLLKQGVPARAILALTFTNKAAAEMKERIAHLVGHSAARHLWMGTFHSIFARILRIEASHTGYSSNYTIYDTSDSRNVIRSIIRELQLDEQVYKPSEVFGRISSAKNNLTGAGAYAANASLVAEDIKSGRPAIQEIFRIYQNRCRNADAMDFDDLLLNTNILFRDHPQVLAKYQDSFRYILVDEYQDTNYAQYLIISRLAAKHKNIAVVGDDAQSIYAFRGARIENILNFKKDYPDHRIFKLEQNYRSTQTIVNAANSIIAKNREQIPKKVWSANETGEKIAVLECETDLKEGTAVAGSLLDKKEATGCSFSDFAVLYRTNAQSRIFEEAMRTRGIPYKVFGSLSFYQRKEIKDLLAYFRLTVNSRDEEAFYRVINYPARGLGKTTVGRLESYSNETRLSPLEIITDIEKHQDRLGINRGTASKLSGFGRLLEGFAGKSAETDAWQLAMHIASASGILRDLFDPKSAENIIKYENIQELLNAVKEFTLQQAELGEDTSLTTFLQNVSLLTDSDTEKEDDRNKVTLMTIHSAKGLEFKHVFIGGLEEELFPSRFAAASMHELEEERRLFYVALTRAGVSATLTWAGTRYRWGVPAICRPSRFLSEIDPRYLDYPENGPEPETGYHENRDRTVRGRENARSYGGPRREKDPLTKQPPVFIPSSSGKLIRLGKAETSSTPATSDLSGLKAGMQVEHDRFGKGEVMNVEGTPPNARATVNFARGGQKQLLLKFARLRIL